jgi:hypothetical protein
MELGNVDVQLVPSDTSKLPLVPGAKVVISEVPFPIISAFAGMVETPVPP